LGLVPSLRAAYHPTASPVACRLRLWESVVMNRLKRTVGHPVVKAAYFLLLVAATAFYLYRWRDHLPELWAQVEPIWVAASLGTATLGALLYILIQYVLYRRLGAQVSYRTTYRIISIAQLGKYLPGKVMFAGNYYLLSRDAGISNVLVGTSFVVSQALWMLTAGLCGLPVLALLDPVLRYTVLAIPLVLALLVSPRFLGWLFRLSRRIAPRMHRESPTLPEGLGATTYLLVALLYLLNWGLAAMSAWFSLRAFGPIGLDVFPLVLASIALGTVAGFVALFAPAGLGVREGLGVMILAPFTGTQEALLGLVLLRGIAVFVDLSLALIGVAAGARWRVVE
jgi:hypothetical protein